MIYFLIILKGLVHLKDYLHNIGHIICPYFLMERICDF